MQSEVWETGMGPVMVSGDFRHIWKTITQVFGVEDPTPPGASLDDKIRHRRAAAGAFFLGLADEQSVVGVFEKMNMAWGHVRASRQLATVSETIRARASIVDVDDRAGGTRPVVQSPYRFKEAESGARGPAPHRGEHNAEVLQEWLELDQGAIDALVERGVLLADQAQA